MSWSLLLALVVVSSLASISSADTSFDAKRAFADLQALVRLGPRIAGSDAAARAHDLIRQRLAQAGWLARDAAEDVTLPDGSAATAANVWASKARAGKPRIFVITHYDTKDISPGGDPGANEGASGVALLLELARQLPDGLRNAELHLVFFDRSEPVGEHIEVRDGLLGSRALVRRFEREGLFAKLAGVLYVDLVADRELSITPGQPRSPDLLQHLQRASALSGDETPIDAEMSYRIPGDHQAFLERGVTEVLPIVDFRFGPGEPPGAYWQSPHDDLTSVTEEALGRSGTIVLTMLRVMSQR